MSNRTLLVTGASGQLGKRVIELLKDSGDNVIAGTRKPEGHKNARLVDFDKPETLDKAFAGVERLLIISTDELGTPGKRLQQQRNAIAAAKRAGVKHIVYTSLPNPKGSVITTIAPDHEGTEQAIIDSGIAYTLLRNNLYMDLSLGGFKQAVASGKLFAAAGNGKVGFITREDCARVAAAALADKHVGSRTLDVAGQSLSYADVAATLADVTGKPVQYVPTTPEQQIEGLVSAGLPKLYARVFVQFNEAAAKGQLDTPSSVVKELTGKAPTSLKEFLTAHKAELTA